MPLKTEDVLPFLVQVLAAGGGGATIVYFLVKGFGEKWLDKRFATSLQNLRHAQEKELERSKHELQGMFSRIVKVHEREYEVMPKAWYLLHEAYGSAHNALEIGVKYGPDFDNLSGPEFEVILKASRLLPFQQDELRESPHKHHYYQAAMRDIELSDAFTAHTTFNNYLIEHRIFMSGDLAIKFFDASKLLRDGLNLRRMSLKTHDAKSQTFAIEKITSVEGMLPAIQKLIQERLCFEKA